MRKQNNRAEESNEDLIKAGLICGLISYNQDKYDENSWPLINDECTARPKNMYLFYITNQRLFSGGGMYSF